MTLILHGRITIGQRIRRQPIEVSFSAIALFYFRVRWLLIWVADCFVRQLAARHHSGFYPETWENNRLQ
jgi:hypothetical protein